MSLKSEFDPRREFRNKARKFSARVQIRRLLSVHIPGRRHLRGTSTIPRMRVRNGLRANQYLINRTIKPRLKRDRFFSGRAAPCVTSTSERTFGREAIATVIAARVRSYVKLKFFRVEALLPVSLTYTCLLVRSQQDLHRAWNAPLLCHPLARFRPSTEPRARLFNFNFRCDSHARASRCACRTCYRVRFSTHIRHIQQFLSKVSFQQSNQIG